MIDDSKQSLTIATRESPLALWQAEHIAARLSELRPNLTVNLLGMTTQGDKMLDGPLSASGGKGLFVKELEHALLDGRADLAVHSGKDMPAEAPPGLMLMTVGPRAEVCDALVLPLSKNGGNQVSSGIAALPQGAIVGTASQRRLSQLRHARPDLDCRSLRGNVNTRLRKLDSGEYDAIVLAAAGLQRLGMQARISALIPTEAMLPAASQGALMVECRSADTSLQALLASLCDMQTSLCVAAERAFSAHLEGGCQLPIAALAQLGEDGVLSFEGMVGDIGGKRLLSHKDSLALDISTQPTPSEQALADAVSQVEHLGRAAAEALLKRGARDLLAASGS